MTENQTKEMFTLLTKCVNGIQKLDGDLTIVKEDISILKEDVSVLKEDVSVLKEDVSILKEDVSILKEDVSILKEDVSVLKEDVAGLKEGQNRIEKEVRLNTAAINEIVSEQFRLKIRVNQLENAPV